MKKAKTFLPLLMEAPHQQKKKQPKPTDTPTSTTTAKSDAVAFLKVLQVITMPRLSDTMTDGTVATWLKKVEKL